jgi:hypothetical protein
MKKRTFLLPLAASLAGFAATGAEAAPATQPQTESQATEVLANSAAHPKVLLLTRAKDEPMYAQYHSSHTSHASHASHRSHYSSR